LPKITGMFGFFAVLLLTANAHAERHGDCCNVWVVIDDRPGTAGFDSRWDCGGGLGQLKPELIAKACREIQSKNKLCAEVAQSCPSNDCTAPKVPYTGTIACDCDGDGKDDNTRSFESCGPLDKNWPADFQARCEDWIRGDSGYGYGTDITLQHKGSDYLDSLECPAIKCHREHQSCETQANDEYEKCTYSGVRRLRVDCLGQQTTAIKKCKQRSDECLEGIR